MSSVISHRHHSADVHGDMDRRIAELAASRLRSQSYFLLRAVSCHAEGGVLTLRGTLPSYYLKQVAQSIAATVPGVARVVNQISVDALRFDQAWTTLEDS